MVRLRNKEGRCLTLTGPAAMNFAEICDEDGKLAAVVMMEAKCRVKVVVPGDLEFSAYAKKYNLPTTVVRIEKEI